MGYSNRTWQCPYYKWDEKLIMHCEAGRLRFPDRDTAVAYFDTFCSCLWGWKKCTLAQSMTRFYENNDKELKK